MNLTSLIYLKYGPHIVGPSKSSYWYRNCMVIYTFWEQFMYNWLLKRFFVFLSLAGDQYDRVAGQTRGII